MGNAQSPSINPRFVTASRAFSQQELDNINSIFFSLSNQSHGDSEHISTHDFQAYFGICEPLANRLFDLVNRKKNTCMINYQDLVIFKAVYEKGTRDEIEEFIYQLCDVNGDGFLERSDLEAVLDSIRDAVFAPKSTQIAMSASKKSVMKTFLSNAPFSQEVDGKAENCMSLADFRNWCNHIPSAKKYLGSLLMLPNTVRPGFQVPHLLYPENLSLDSLILQKEYAWHILGALSQTEAEHWMLAYHSSIHGLSFTTFMGSISNIKGPTILVIKDTEGHIYGGYASQPWNRHNNFYGDLKSFLFQLYPQASIFRPTGLNNNLQWCAVNFSSESIPNGIGFGGRANHFGLFLSASFDHGHSFICTTFNSPCLSKMSTFKPDVIECWAVAATRINKENAVTVEGTVLERFKEDRNLLELVGLANSS